MPFGEVQIKRTKGRKPFVIAAVERPHAPNFNFNVSHEVRMSKSCSTTSLLVSPGAQLSFISHATAAKHVA